VLNHYKTEVDVKISLVHFVHDQMRVVAQGLWVVDQALEENTCRHEEDLRHTSSFFGCHSNVVADGMSDFLADLLGHAFCDVDSSKTPRLRADNLDVCLL
jgi:deoxyhypusine synthase